ncbi:LysR family transcriptional regulator [Rivibacter subsaxonicus]|uniref:DNA-binding transcriptional LysR family regulator n=1 Tax=Rivibacter subsaxonicus TaxID=457575 RepID=A0A4Q7V9U0_9BURK|nr:LysR family transcriptional regulator [Rivibacter subsaxonicus]RZT92477.1 DNA-binding transcriptional LysR family regulator [Rivibacter subsaxonicus]
MNELKAMRTFAQVADSGSFINASRALDVAPAVVTRVVAELEQHLGARLMTRTTRRVTLTEVGERYLDRVRGILEDVEEATGLVRQTQSEPDGEVRVAASPEFAAHQLARRLPRFHAVCPKVVVKVTAAGPVRSLDPGQDITIVVKQSPLDGDFIARRLARSEVIGCATPEYLDRFGRPSHPSELVGHRLLTPPLQGAITFSRRPDDDCSAGECVTVIPTLSQLHSMNPDLHRASALAGLGIAGLPSFSIDGDLRNHSLEQVLPAWHVADLSIWACMPTRRHVPASTRAFMEFLVDEFGGVEDDPWIPSADFVRTLVQ